MKNTVLAAMFVLGLSVSCHAGREFERLPLDAEQLASFLGVQFSCFAFTPPKGKTKVGCAITEYAVAEAQPVTLGEIASVPCEADYRFSVPPANVTIDKAMVEQHFSGGEADPVRAQCKACAYA